LCQTFALEYFNPFLIAQSQLEVDEEAEDQPGRGNSSAELIMGSRNHNYRR
jgi:hypothetical protein